MQTVRIWLSQISKLVRFPDLNGDVVFEGEATHQLEMPLLVEDNSDDDNGGEGDADGGGGDDDSWCKDA